MDGKEKIIARILDDAQQKCNEILDQAQAKAQAIVDNCQQNIDKQRKSLQEKLTLNSQEIMRNTLSGARLNAKKYQLQQKQNLVDKVYNECLSKLKQLKDKEYVALISKLLNKYAEQGEVVRIAEKDSKVITQELLDKANKGLTLSSEFVDIDGGIILEGQSYDKNLSLSNLVKYAREDTEMAVAHKLFEE